MADELINFELPVNQSSLIKVIGVGGGGGNAVNHMYKSGIKDVDFVLCNTDVQALANSPVPVKVQLGATLTEGRGSGNKPEIGRQAAIENLDDVLDILSSNTKMVFITAGMGGGTGTGAAPVIAKAAKELGILTVAILTIPFRNEGLRRINQAMEGIAEIEQYVDSLLVVNNEKIREIYGDLKISEAFAEADNVLAIAAKGIAEIITVPGYINVDFADVETVMTNSGVAIMGSAFAEGEDRAITAVKKALSSPLLNDNDITGAKNILINITSGTEEITMDESQEITDFVQDCAGDADLIWGNGRDEKLGNKICVTIIATGFETSSIPELYVRKRQLDRIPLDEIRDKDTPGTSFEVKSKEKTENENIFIEQRTIEFDLTESSNNNRMNIKKPDLFNSTVDIKKSAERVKNIKKTYESMRELDLNSPKRKDTIDELENQPAYLRKNIKLDDVKYSKDSNISKYSLSNNNDDDDNKAKLSENNPYLHKEID